MPEPTAMLQAVRAATADLLKGLDDSGWSDTDLTRPSRCKGWTRAHVLTHLARNAEGITSTLSGSLRGEVVPRYPGGQAQRDADIDAGAGRSLTAVVADLTECCERLDRVFGALSEADGWDGLTEREHPADHWPARRLCEVELHRVDLDAGYSPRQWPPVLVGDLLPRVADTLDSRAPDPVHVIVAESDSIVPTLAGRSWGDADGTLVEAPDWALLAWLTGRGDAAGDVLVAAPALAPWD